MKTIQQIEAEISRLLDDANALLEEKAKSPKPDLHKAKLSRIRKKVAEKREMILLLEKCPTVEMIQRERLKMQERLQTINTTAHFESWCKANMRDPEKDISAQKDHDKEFRLKDIQRHYRNAGYLLNSLGD